MVDADAYLLELAAYIHLNPVRVHITERPENYRWSSHRAYLGNESYSWLETDSILSQFSKQLSRARLKFAKFVGERVSDGRRAVFHGETNIDSRIIGDDDFISDLLSGGRRSAGTKTRRECRNCGRKKALCYHG